MTNRDPRAVANTILDEADRQGYWLSNLVLQKLLYLAHAIYLIEEKEPLVSGYFEAWQYGPVHPGAYQAFKASGSHPITGRAESVDPVTLERKTIASPSEPRVNRVVTKVLSHFGHMSVGQLVDIMHAKDAPWDFVVKSAADSAHLGLRIPDRLIVDRFKYHKVSMGPVPNSGEPDEDSPFA
jgi:uncharacterized phage-associated protein